MSTDKLAGIEIAMFQSVVECQHDEWWRSVKGFWFCGESKIAHCNWQSKPVFILLTAQPITRLAIKNRHILSAVTKCSVWLLFTFSKPFWYKIRRWHRKKCRIASFCSHRLCQVWLSSPRRLHTNSVHIATTHQVSSQQIYQLTLPDCSTVFSDEYAAVDQQWRLYQDKKHLKIVGPIRPAASRPNFTLPFTRCHYCCTPPAHRCPQQRRQQRQRVTEGTAMAP